MSRGKWKPFPKVKPKKPGNYLVTVDPDYFPHGICLVDYLTWNGKEFGYYDSYASGESSAVPKFKWFPFDDEGWDESSIIAWRKAPKPYKKALKKNRKKGRKKGN